MATQQEVIKSFMASLDTTTLKGSAALDAAIKAATGNKYSSTQAVIAEMKKNIEATNDADKFLRNYCGIILENNDVGAITGSDAGGSKTKTAESIVPESGSLKNFEGNLFTLSKYDISFYLSKIESDGRVNLNGFEVPNLDFEDLTPEQKHIWQSLYSYWADDALNLIAESYGSNFGFASSSLILPKRIYFGFYDRNDSSNAESGSLAFSDSTKKETKALVFRVNMNKFKSIDTSDPNGANSNGEYLDRTLAHEFTHCVMAANINYYNYLPQFIKEGMAELTQGADDIRKPYLEEMAVDSTRLVNALDLNNTSTGTPDAYAGGYMFMRYLSKQVAEQSATQGINVSNAKNSTTISGTDYADTLSNTGSKVTIKALGGNDSILSNNSSVSVSGDAGDDYIESSGFNVTIDGGADNDTIKSDYDNTISVAGNTGDDLISLKSVWYSTIDGGNDDDTILASLSKLDSISGGTGNDLISLSNSYSDGNTVKGDLGKDTIYVDGENILVYGEADNDFIRNQGGKNITISGGAGADSLYNNTNNTVVGSGASVSIDAGAGNDYIYNSGSNATINGGAGADSLENTGASVLFVYASGDGNDVITGFNTTSTLQLGDGTAEYSKATDSNDNLIVTVGEGNITLTGAAKLNPLNILGVEKNPLNIVGTDKAETFNNSLASATIQALGGNDTIINSGATVSINGGADVDSINNSGTKVTILGDAGNDKILNSGTYAKINAGTGNDSIKNTAASVSIVGGTGKDSITNTKTKVTINAGDGNDRIVNSAASVSIIAGTGNDLVSIGANAKNNFISYTAGNDTIKGFNATSTLKIGDGSDTYSKDTDANNLILTVGDYAVTIIGAAGLTNPNILGEEIIATVVFTDSEVEKTTLDGQIITADATARTKAIKITGNALDNSILGGGGKDSLYGGNGADYLAGGADNDKLYGQAGNDYLEGGAGNDLLSGYTGNDTLWGGSGNDTLTGGTGKDLFVYSTGNDVISDYAAGDKISLGAEISSTSLNGSDVVFTIGKYKLTVKDATDTDLTMIDASDKEFTTVVSDAVTYDDTAAAKVSLASYVEVGDASARTAAIKITGNTLDNMILGGDGNDSIEGGDGADYLAGGAGNDKLLGQNGDDTLWGGIGNDTLTGGTGTDTFIYHSGEGKDVITDFGNDDMLQIIGAFSANYDASAKALAFKVGTTANALRLTNFTATMLSINGKDYAISGTKLVK